MIQKRIFALAAFTFAFSSPHLCGQQSAEPPALSYLTFDNTPMGTEERPLVFRTYSPNPGLDEEVTARHGNGAESPKYSASTGISSTRSNYQPIEGIPAAFGVNAGPNLSYVWDTTECRLLYAWVDGFMDMESYWGTKDRGSRKSNDYVPRLVGQLFYKAKGQHPLQINGKQLPDEIRYTGHRRESAYPVFSFEADGRTISVDVRAGDSPQTLHVTYSSSEEKDKLSYVDLATPFEILEQSAGELRILIRPNSAETYTGFKKEEIKITEASAEIGEKLYRSYGCMACHSVDGSRNHGPTFAGLSGEKRDFPGVGQVVADGAYLKESILKPAAKSVPDYPVGMMPAYPLNEKQIDSLVLYIQSLAN